MSHQGVTFEEKFKTRFFVIVSSDSNAVPAVECRIVQTAPGLEPPVDSELSTGCFKCEKVRATSALRNRKIQKVPDTVELWACDLDHNYNATMVRKA
jgi:hypothetical protein